MVGKKSPAWIFKGLLVLSWVFFAGHYFIHHFFFGGIVTDVAKRLEAPDHSKTAVLLRRKAFDLNFLVQVKRGWRSSIIYVSPDYNTDPTINWKENIQWSPDSSILVFTTDAVASFQSRVWAYDFRANAPLSDREKILALLKERNSR